MNKRPSGHYGIDLRHRRLRGGRLAISLDTKQKRIAEQREAAIRVLVDRGEWAALERLRDGTLHISDAHQAVRHGEWHRLVPPDLHAETLGQAVEAKLRSVEATRSEGTRKQYQTTGNLLVARFGPDTLLVDISREDARRFLHDPQASAGGRVWAPNTQHSHAVVAGAIWKDAASRRQEAGERVGVDLRPLRNVWSDVDLPQIRQTRVAFLRPAEWRALMRAVEGRPVAALLALGCLAGLRQQEAAHLRTGIDVDLDKRVLHIQSRSGEHAWKTKTQRSERDVPMPDALHRILVAHIESGFAGARYFVRPVSGDRPLGGTTVLQWTREAYQAAGLRYGRTAADSLVYHSLRHTYASWMVQADVQLLKVAELMGDTVEVVARVYSHLLPRDLARAVTHIDATVGEK